MFSKATPEDSKMTEDQPHQDQNNGDDTWTNMVFDSLSQVTAMDASMVSSEAPSRCSTKLATLFPENATTPGVLDPMSPLFNFLHQILQLSSNFIMRLEQVGFVTPHVIVNRFGLSTHHIKKGTEGCQSQD